MEGRRRGLGYRDQAEMMNVGGKGGRPDGSQALMRRLNHLSLSAIIIRLLDRALGSIYELTAALVSNSSHDYPPNVHRQKKADPCSWWRDALVLLHRQLR